MSAISVAPMMAVSDRWFRRVMRVLAPSFTVYTEMVVAQAVIHGRRDRLLGFFETEHPIVLQIGGDDPRALAQAAKIGEDIGYDAINLNCGCPSDRVQAGAFGACLMKTPVRVAEAYSAIASVVKIPITVKCRIGVDDLDEYEHLEGFVDTVSDAGCSTFIVHARKAWLKGLSPKENRNVPPLRHHEVWRLKAQRPALDIHTNGGITTTEQVQRHLEHVDGAMIGRAAVDNPWWIASLAQTMGEPNSPRDRLDVVESVWPIIYDARAQGREARHVTRHLLQLFAGQPGARSWRRILAEQANTPDGGLTAAVAMMRSLSENPWQP